MNLNLSEKPTAAKRPKNKTDWGGSNITRGKNFEGNFISGMILTESSWGLYRSGEEKRCEYLPGIVSPFPKLRFRNSKREPFGLDLRMS